MPILRFITILFILFTFFAERSDAQKAIFFEGDSINKMDNFHRRVGKWVFFDPSGKTVLERGTYTNGKKEGIWTAFYTNGQTKHIIQFVGGVAKGPAKFYYEDGQLWEEGIWDIDHWTGNYKFYYPNGKTAYDWNYDDTGKRTGIQKYYHENGQIKYQGKWEDGQTQGTLAIYDENGKLAKQRIYDDGKLTEIVEQPKATDGTAKEYTVFKGTGNHTIFNAKGQPEKSGYFDTGKLIDGEKYIYDENNNLIKTIRVRNGVDYMEIEVKK